MSFLKKYKLVLIISVVLSIIPFFWFKPGEIDIGGDGGRLYFYDAVNNIKYFMLYSISPIGTGSVSAAYFYIPLASLIAFLDLFLSSHTLSILHNSLKLSIGFLSIYLIMKEFILGWQNKNDSKNEDYLGKVEITAILTGFFVILTGADSYVNPLASHDQVFLNPFMFYLIMKYFLTKNMRYLWTSLAVSLVFSHSFSYTSAPPFFAFYPLTILFLILYVTLICKKQLPAKGALIGLILFVFLHLFHLVPEYTNLYDPGLGLQVGKEDYKAYFYGILGLTNLSKKILQPFPTDVIWFPLTIIVPFITILGILRNKSLENRTQAKFFLLTALFFLITLFFVSAKVTFSSVKLYEIFFLYIPGFGMFRNFYGQWAFVFLFFYSLLFGQSLFLMCSRLNKTRIKLFSLALLIFFIGSGWTLVNGKLFNPIHYQSNNVGQHIIMDPKYEEMLSFIRTLPIDGKVLLFPFTDFNYQVIHGINNGAFVGSSTIGQLTGIKDFSGYWHVAPFSDAFIQSAQKKDYERLREIIGILNIRYIFHNADPKVYDDTFLDRPYGYVRKFLPSNQKDYEEFIKPLVSEKLFETGPYKLYVTEEASYLPHIYVPAQTIIYGDNPKYNKEYAAASSFILEKQSDGKRVIFIEKKSCKSNPLIKRVCEERSFTLEVPHIYFKKINPIKYLVKIENVKGPFFLVLSEQFHRDWRVFISEERMKEESGVKAYFNGDIKEGKPENIFYDSKTFETLKLKTLPETKHFSVNAYANAWYIIPQDIQGKQEATFIVEMTGQRTFYFAAPLSLLTLTGFTIWGLILFLRKGVSYCILSLRAYTS